MHVRIRAKRKQGLWRCGRHWTRGWEEFKDPPFTEEQLERLRKDPNLEVHFMQDKAVEPPPKDKTAAPPPKAKPAEGGGDGDSKDDDNPQGDEGAPGDGEQPPDAEPVDAEGDEDPKSDEGKPLKADKPAGEPERCHAETTAGRRCGNQALSGSKYCRLHQPKTED